MVELLNGMKMNENRLLMENVSKQSYESFGIMTVFFWFYLF